MGQPNSGGALPLDTRVLVATPENIAFDFRLAGPFPRAVALLLDLMLIIVVLVVLGFVLLLLGGTAGFGLLLFVGFVVWWGYGALMEAFYNGQTLGKKIVGIKVVSDSGLAINAGQSFVRNIIRWGDLFPPFYPGIVCMLFGSKMQRLGDLAAGTMVVLDGQRSSPRPPLLRSRNDTIHELIPVRYRPDPKVLEALAGYVGRRTELSAARRRELARILATHFTNVWSLPEKTDPDHILCAIYEHSTTDKAHRESANRKSKKRTDVEVMPPIEPNDGEFPWFNVEAEA